MLNELYSRRIREFAEKPLPALLEVAVEVSLDNPFCGDQVTLQIRLQDGLYREIRASVDGCLLCRAAMALVVEKGAGLTSDTANRLLADVSAFLEGGLPSANTPWPELEMFSPLVAHRARRKCVLLPFQALARAGKLPL